MEKEDLVSLCFSNLSLSLRFWTSQSQALEDHPELPCLMLKPLRTVGKSQGVEYNWPIAQLFGYFPRLKHRLRFLLKSSSALKVEALQLILHQ
ncbi:hypothetical protein YC2023_075578 [Brassica napus]